MKDSKEWLAAKDIATSYVVYKELNEHPYPGEDEMIEDRRCLALDIYYDMMERRNGS